MKHLKPAGRGAPAQTTAIASDFGSPSGITIVRYGPNSSNTDTPASRVATGRVPPTGGGMVRYTASTDGSPIHMPQMDRASKWHHGGGLEESFSRPNAQVAQTGPSQNPKQAKLTRTGKKTGD